MPSAPPKVFVSYSHDSDPHKAHVLELVQRLRDKGGIDATLDQFVETLGPHWPTWTEQQVEESELVLVVCTAELKQALRPGAPRETRKGVRWEMQAAFQEIYNRGVNERFLPVLLDGATEDDIPIRLQGVPFYQPDSKPGFVKLLRRIRAMPEVLPVPLGNPMDLPARPAVLPALPDQAKDEQSRLYLQRLREDTGSINPGWIDLNTAQATTFPIGHVYVPLKRALPGESGREFTEGAGAPEPALEAALRRQYLVIQGDAGSGKSTFIRCAAFDLACSEPGATPLNLPVRGYPLYARVADVDSHVSKTWEQSPAPPGSPTFRTDPQWLPHFLAALYKAPPAFFEWKLTQADTILLLDGLDEAPEDNREYMALFLARVARDYPRCRIVVTTRPGGLKGPGRPAEFAEATIAPFDDEAIERFVARWYACKYAKEPDKAERERALLSAALQMPEIRERELARNPLMLAALTVIHFNGGRLPDNRLELYDTILQWLARARRDPLGRVSPEQRLKRLRHLAWGMQTAEGGRVRTVEVGAAIEILAAPLGREAARLCILHDEADGGILLHRGKNVEFAHLTFQEFLAAKRLADMDDIYQELCRENRHYSLEWREVVRFLAADQSKIGEGSANRLFSAILNRTGEPIAARARTVALLTLLRDDLSTTDRNGHVTEFEVANPGLAEFTRQMTALFDEPAAGADLDAETRAQAAEAWERLGDLSCLRCPEDDDYWVDLGRFRIGRHPVTVGEYAKFIEAGGSEPRWPRWTEQCRWPYRPVVGISWHGAVAYCEWAGVRLPTSEQWEFAAAGESDREFPWGIDQPDGEKANFENNVGRITPAGLFPAGSTPEGVSDMAGNVWEWTDSDYDTDSKVLRGGSFYDDAGLLRAVVRSGFLPDDRNDNFGFRCVRE